MRELEKILEEIDEIKVGFNTECRSECDLYDWSCGACVGECDEYIKESAKEIIRKHMNDGWIPVEERMPTQEECEDNWFWIAYGDSFGNSPIVARCEWVFADDENGNDASGSEFYIDQFPLPYKPSKNLIKAWKIIDIPAPYRPERNGT